MGAAQALVLPGVALRRNEMSPEVIVADTGVLAQALVDRLGVVTREAAAAGSRLSMALPGGSTAEALLPPLAEAKIDWTRWDFFWGDERAVAPDDPDSNYGLCQRLFLGPIGVEPRHVHRVKGEGPDLEAAAVAYEAELVSVLGEAAAIDFALMGMGLDGHVCSLFPGHPGLRERTRRVIAVSDSPKPPPRRITMTMPALEAARVVCVAAFGESKAEALGAGLGDPASTLPVALVARGARHALFLLDPPAAARLSR
jgi:6-phosphogluconolactonase